MEPGTPPDLEDRLAAMERRLDDIHARVSAPPKAQGGIGCLGVVLFLILFVRLGEVLDLVRALGQ